MADYISNIITTRQLATLVEYHNNNEINMTRIISIMIQNLNIINITQNFNIINMAGNHYNVYMERDFWNFAFYLYILRHTSFKISPNS